MSSPLDSFASPLSGGAFKLRSMPKLAETVSAFGLIEGCRRFDQLLEEWRVDLERQANATLAVKAPVTGKL